ncbi:restriction endonuclease subunit S [Marinomonas algicola]|uniref:restriction endonuclease subunit S n=1 Tax=Marinomonas algicola TaxID=2773454 RepID=UPI0019D593C0|nr:restriction endonuclease subunit S [Marinomonas algicola]
MANLSVINLNNVTAVGAKREGMDSPSHSLALLPKYESYKESGAEWLGEIPDNWELISLKRLLKFHTGGTPPSGNQQFYDGDLPWITIADLNERFTNRHHCLSRLGVRQARIPLTPKGSLLYSFKLSIGQVAFASTDIYTNEAIASFIPRDNLNLNYYYYALPIFLENNAAVNIYGAKLLNQDLIKNAWILKLDDDEQTRIANFLDQKTTQIDEAIAIKEQQISLLKERKQIIIQQAVTQGLDPNVPMKDSGVDWIGKIPAHWEVKRLKYVLEERNERSKTGEEPLFMVSQIHGLVVRADYHDKAEVAASNIDNKVVYKNDLVFNKLKAHLGVFFKSNIEFKGLVSPDYAVYKCKEHISDAKYLEILFRHPSYIQQFIIRATGVVEGLIRLYTGDLFDIPVPVAPSGEQAEILAYTKSQSSAYEKAIEIQQNQIEKLKEYKTSLINSAVTGKIKITPEMVEQ